MYCTSSLDRAPMTYWCTSRLIKRTSIAARLFYHTAMCLLSQINPILSADVEDMRQLQLMHAHQICGIVAHSPDKSDRSTYCLYISLTDFYFRGVIAISIRSLAIAADCLVVREEQEEVVRIFDRIERETGWRISFISEELKQTWGWNHEQQVLEQQQQQEQQQQASQPHQGSLLQQPLSGPGSYQATPPQSSYTGYPPSNTGRSPAPPGARKYGGAAAAASRMVNPLVAAAAAAAAPSNYPS